MLDKFLKKKLPSNFYLGDVNKVARNLLGKIFVKKYDNNFLAGKIVEVEAYHGLSDQAAHSFNGVTERNKTMFQKGGYLYVYFIYGVHYCSNVVTGSKGEGDAVLIRGIEPIVGNEIMAQNRFGTKDINKNQFLNLTNGPAKFSKAFNLDFGANGKNLNENEIFISLPLESETFEIVETTRIGIAKSVDLNWRYYIKNNRFVSKK